MSDVLHQARDACREVAVRARSVSVVTEAIPAYARSLPLRAPAAPADPSVHLLEGAPEELAAFWLTLDAINFGSGWFPTLRKPERRSGYFTVAGGLRERFARTGAWSAEELATITAVDIAQTLGQDAGHELMGLFAAGLNDLGARVTHDYGGRFHGVVEAADRSVVRLVTTLSGWTSFADVSAYGALEVPFLKRAQIAAADLARVGVGGLQGLERLTMFADNLVPHVLRLDGLLDYDPSLAARIEAGERLEHGSPAEVEIRACALHAVELIVAARPGTFPAEVDQLLWHRGQEAEYKSRPRHRTRCTAY